MHGDKVWLKSPVARFFAGYPVVGYWKTDATWLQAGTRSTGRRDPLSRLAYYPGWKRAIIRNSLVLAGSQTALDELTDHVTMPDLVTRYAGGYLEALTDVAGGFDASDAYLTVGLTAGGLYVTGVALRRAGVDPIAGVVGMASGLVGRAVKLDAVHPDVRRTERAVRQNVRGLVKTERPIVRAALDGRKVSSVSVTLPPNFALTEPTSKSLSDAVRRVVGSDWDVVWPDLVTSREVEWTRPLEIATVVPYASIRQTMLDAPSGSLVLGLDASDAPLIHSLDSDEPHIALSMGTGRGKSTFYLSVIAQLLEQGADVDIADVKRISLEEFRDVEGVTIHKNIQGIWDALENFRTEMMERVTTLEQLPPEEWSAYLDSLRRRVFVFEEMNAFRTMSQAHWDRVRGAGQRAMPPIYSVLSEILMMARAVRMHVFVAGQRLSAKAIGDGDMREQFGLRLLSNPSRQTWNLLADGTMPARSKVRGRAIAVMAGESTIFQGVYMKLPDVLAHVTARRQPSSYVLPSYVSVTRENSYDMGHGTRRLVTLSEFSESHGLSLPAVRKAAQRPGYPASVTTGERGAKMYDESELREHHGIAESLYDPSEIIEDVDQVS